jgi:hypothetical protein
MHSLSLADVYTVQSIFLPTRYTVSNTTGRTLNLSAQCTASPTFAFPISTGQITCSLTADKQINTHHWKANDTAYVQIHKAPNCVSSNVVKYEGADKSLARSEMKQVTATNSGFIHPTAQEAQYTS